MPAHMQVSARSAYSDYGDQNSDVGAFELVDQLHDIYAKSMMDGAADRSSAEMHQVYDLSIWDDDAAGAGADLVKRDRPDMVRMANGVEQVPGAPLDPQLMLTLAGSMEPSAYDTSFSSSSNRRVPKVVKFMIALLESPQYHPRKIKETLMRGMRSFDRGFHERFLEVDFRSFVWAKDLAFLKQSVALAWTLHALVVLALSLSKPHATNLAEGSWDVVWQVGALGSVGVTFLVLICMYAARPVRHWLYSSLNKTVAQSTALRGLAAWMFVSLSLVLLAAVLAAPDAAARQALANAQTVSVAAMLLLGNTSFYWRRLAAVVLVHASAWVAGTGIAFYDVCVAQIVRTGMVASFVVAMYLLRTYYTAFYARLGYIMCFVCQEQRNRAETERQTAEYLLYNILPPNVVERLRDNPHAVIADPVDDATIVEMDLVGFTNLCSIIPSSLLVAMLNEFFCILDQVRAGSGAEGLFNCARER